MIHADICCDIASIAIEINGSVFTIGNDIGCDGGYTAHLYETPADIDNISDAEFLNNRNQFESYKMRFIVGKSGAKICWSDCFDPSDVQQIKAMYTNFDRDPYAMEIPQGVYAVYCFDGHWHFVKNK